MMKIKKIIKMSELKQEFGVLSVICGGVMYKATICNVPAWTCPDFLKKAACWYHVCISYSYFSAS